jgi:signal transduction histidine kinase
MTKEHSSSPPDPSTLVAHELQAPLTALNARLAAALDASWCTGEVEVLLRDCLGEVRDMSGLIVDVLLLDRAESGRLSGQAGKLDLALMAQDVAKNLLPLAEAKSLRIETNAGEALQVAGHKGQLERVLTNLVENAIKYTCPGGSVHLEAKRIGSTAELRVSDTGIGIPSDELERVFERFYQVDPERSRKEGGVGLGLCIARALAEGNGGSIGVTSTPGQGSCFTFRIRLA